MGDQSLLDEMRAAVRGDFERARQRRGRAEHDAAPAPLVEIRPAPSPPTASELRPDVPQPEPEESARHVAHAALEPPDAVPQRSLVARLLGR